MWTYTSFLPLYLKSCHVLLKLLCMSGGFSLTPVSWWGGPSLLCCLLSLPSPCCSHSPSACASVLAPSPAPAGQRRHKPRARWDKPVGRKLLAGNQKEELCHRPVGGGDSGTAQGLSHGLAAFAGEDREPICASAQGSWIWSDLHCNNHQKNLFLSWLRIYNCQSWVPASH